MPATGGVILASNHIGIIDGPLLADGTNARFQGVVTRCEAPRVLSFTWNMGEEDSEVTFELAPRGAEVLLVITHRRLEGRVLRVNVASGWDAHVGILEDRLRGVEPRPFWSTHARLEREQRQAPLLDLDRTGVDLVVTESETPRGGAYLDTLGYYNPRSKPAELRIDLQKVDQWIGRGASPNIASAA